MSNMRLPTDLMRETAGAMNTDSDNLLDTHTQIWQKIHGVSATLPLHMQDTFSTFHSSLENHLTETLNLRQHIGKTLSDAADLADSTDTSITRLFGLPK